MVQQGELAVADSVLTEMPGLTRGIVLERPREEPPRPLGDSGSGMSWILSGLFLLFAVVCLRYRKNTKFFSMMLHDITEVRERHNAFDDTVRETTFLWLLNILWCGATGILFFGLLCAPEAGAGLSRADVWRIAACTGMAGAYTLFLTAAYATVGSLFADSSKASLWVKGYLSTQGLESIMLFPVALLALCVPGLLNPMLVTAAIVFFSAKLIFIYKGFCIFFSSFASWVLFLYYLCSLEIVPIVLTYASTRYLCALI